MILTGWKSLGLLNGVDTLKKNVNRAIIIDFIAIVVSLDWFRLITIAVPKSNSFIFVDSQKKLLEKENLVLLDKNLLRLARNEILARHGYMFKDKELAKYFAAESWYRPDPKYNGKLNEIEGKNIKLIQFFEKMVNKPYNLDELPNNKLEADVDLNNDGVLEKINVVSNKNKTSEYGEYLLKINNSVIKLENIEDETYVNIVDIDRKDTYKEIAVMARLGNDCTDTVFYAFDGKKIIKIGELGASDSETNTDGNGIVTTHQEFSLLTLWHYEEDYSLKPNMTLEPIGKKYYETTDRIMTLKLKLPMKVYKSPNSKDFFIIKKGEQVKLIGSDDKKWCYIKNSKGQIGCFEVISVSEIKSLKKPAEEVFEGII
jgi:hypothetical protein